MKIYPNPARSTTYISIPSEMKDGGRLIVRNNFGAIVEKQNFTVEESKLIALDLRCHPNGVYNVSLSDDKLEVNSDLVKLVSSN